MRFPIIKIKPLLLNANQKTKNILTKFVSLSESSLRSLQNANKSLGQLAFSFLGLTGKSPSAHHHDLIRSAENLDAMNFHQMANLYRIDLTKQKMAKWYVEAKCLSA